MKRVFLSVLLVMMVVLSACNEKDLKVHSSKVPDVEEVLKLNPDADIFQWNDRIYQTGIDWIDELHLTKNKELGKITSITPEPDNHLYKDGMANKLPIGAKIFSTKERDDVLLVEWNGKVIKYLGVSEG